RQRECIPTPGIHGGAGSWFCPGARLAGASNRKRNVVRLASGLPCLSPTALLRVGPKACGYRGGEQPTKCELVIDLKASRVARAPPEGGVVLTRIEHEYENPSRGRWR